MSTSTNKYNLPEYLVKLLSKDYCPIKGRISVTQLIGEPLVRNLKMKHHDDLVYDVSDRLQALIGNGLHFYLFEKTTEDEDFAEEKLVDTIGGWDFVGKCDNYSPENKSIIDFKTCKIWAWIYRDEADSQINSYVKQMNCYVWQWRRRGFEVNTAYLDLFFKDWAKTKASYEKNYPPCQFVRLEVPVWDFEKQERYIRERLEYHTTNRFTECSPISKWQSETRYAAMKTGGKRALKLFDTKEEAQNFKSSHKDVNKIHIDERLGECTKCKFYCDVSKVCPFYKETK